MQVRFHGRDHNMEIECNEGTSVRQALAAAGVLASTVIVSHDGVVSSACNPAQCRCRPFGHHSIIRWLITTINPVRDLDFRIAVNLSP